MRGKNKNNKEIVPCHIGVDLLGSDIPPKELLKAVLPFCKDLKPSIHLKLFGTASLFAGFRARYDHISFQVVKEAITMEEAPLTAIRRKRGSSLCLGIQMLKEGKLQAFVSAGNTGALMACAKLMLPSLPQVERPALLTLLPTRLNEIAVLDVGANTTYKSKHLLHFAAMGIAYQRSRGIKKPKVGLLNIGSEAKKGTPELQEVYHQLQLASSKDSSSFSFVGNIEGRDVFHGQIDVLVTDGFTGNVFLKTAEGIAAVILEELEKISLEGASTFKGILAELRHHLHYAEYPGALLCGVDGIVIKCHGDASAQSLARSITIASRLIEHRFIDQVRQELKSSIKK
jgi:glycerol-3-phosphate acyltransferase PlsX